jgi:DNA-binding NtrC family response regulator
MTFTSILIVEPESEMRERLKQAFESRGYRTWTCPAADVALECLATVQPQVMLVNLDGSEAWALELLEGLQRQRMAVRVIVGSAHADPTRMREIMDRGAYAFLLRPFSIEPLFDLLERPMQRRSAAA